MGMTITEALRELKDTDGVAERAIKEIAAMQSEIGRLSKEHTELSHVTGRWIKQAKVNSRIIDTMKESIELLLTAIEVATIPEDEQ
jgi:hypothetical protein